MSIKGGMKNYVISLNGEAIDQHLHYLFENLIPVE